MNRTNTVPMPPQVSWTIEVPILGQMRRCTWDRDHGLTIEGLGGDESTTIVKGLVATAMATYQKQKAEEPRTAKTTTAVNLKVDGAEVANSFNTDGARSGRLDSSQPNEANTPKSAASVGLSDQILPIDRRGDGRPTTPETAESSSTAGPEPVATESDPPGVAQRRRVNWSRRKNFDNKPIKDIKVMTNGGAAILFEDGTGCSADEYGNIVSRQHADMAVMAAQGGDNPPTEETKSIPVETDEDAQRPLPLAETTPTEPAGLTSEPETATESAPATEPEHDVTPAEDPSAKLDIDGLGLTDDMILSVSETISHLYHNKKVTKLSDLIAICENLRARSSSFERVKDMKKRMRSAVMALDLSCT